MMATIEINTSLDQVLEVATDEESDGGFSLDMNCNDCEEEEEKTHFLASEPISDASGSGNYEDFDSWMADGN